MGKNAHKAWENNTREIRMTDSDLGKLMQNSAIRGIFLGKLSDNTCLSLRLSSVGNNSNLISYLN